MSTVTLVPEGAATPPSLAQAVDQALAALGSSDPKTRAGAVRLLGLARDPLATLPLLDLIVRGDVTAPMAMWAIGEIGEPNAWVERVLFDAYRARFCFNYALRALGRVASLNALPHLLLAAHRDPDAALDAASRVAARFDLSVLSESARARLQRQLIQLEKKYGVRFEECFALLSLALR